MVGNYALQLCVSGGAVINGEQEVLRLGVGGGQIGAIAAVYNLLAVRDDIVVLDGDELPFAPAEDSFLTFSVRLAHLGDASTRATFHYEPDYETNYALWKKNVPFSGPRVKVDGDNVYAALGSSLYRYHLSSAKGQRPLLISSIGTFLGDPHRGVVYVSRPDGVWSLRPRSHDILAQLVAPSTTPVSTIATIGNTTYIGFDSGELRGVNVDSGATVLDSMTGRPIHIEGDLNRIYVVCSTNDRSKVTVFSRPDTPSRRARS